MSEIGYTSRPVKYKHSNPNIAIVDPFDYVVGAGVPTVNDLYSIPPGKIRRGGLVFVDAENSHYMLADKSEISNELGWEEFSPKSNKIKINGNDFSYIPIVGNDGSSFQAGDIAKDGWLSQTSFGKLLTYKGSGDPTLSENWNIIESI